MNKHLLSSLNGKKKVSDFIKGSGYSFSPRLKVEDIEVNDITLYDEIMINNYLIHCLDKKYHNLLLVIKKTIDSDDSDEDYLECLGLIAQYEDILVHQYKCFLKRKKYQEFFDNLQVLRELVESKIIAFAKNVDYNMNGGRK